LRGILSPSGGVEDVDREVGEEGAEGEGEVVAATLDEHEIDVGVAGGEGVDGFEVGGGVLADGGVGAGAGLDADDAVGIEDAVEGAAQDEGVFLREDVVGDDAG